MALELGTQTATWQGGLTSRRAGRSRHAVRRTAPGAAKIEQQRQIDDVRAREQRLLEAHRRRFPTAQRPLIPAPAAVDEEQIRQQQTAKLLSEVSRFNRSGRAAARVEAIRNADAQVARLRMARLDSLERAQASADSAWDLLVGHDPDAVRSALTSAYETNAFPTSVLEVWSDAAANGVTVVVRYGTPEDVPHTMVVEAPDGTAELQERDQRSRNACYLQAMGSTVLATVRHTLSACPSVDTVSVLVVRDDNDHIDAVALFAGQFHRDAATRPSRWDADPTLALLDSEGALLRLTGPEQEVRPLDPRELPGLNDLLASLTGGR